MKDFNGIKGILSAMFLALGIGAIIFGVLFLDMRDFARDPVTIIAVVVGAILLIAAYGVRRL